VSDGYALCAMNGDAFMYYKRMQLTALMSVRGTGRRSTKLAPGQSSSPMEGPSFRSALSAPAQPPVSSAGASATARCLTACVVGRASCSCHGRE
jgi:hypothetical protein